MEDRKLNEKESLALITQMIENTRNRFIENSGAPFIIWGYTTIFVSLFVWYFWKTTGNVQWNFAWFLIPIIGGLISYFHSKQRRKTVFAKTYIDRLTNYIWLLLGVSVLILSVIAFIIPIPILFFVLFCMNTGTVLTGITIRFKPVIVCGIGGILLSYVLLFVPGFSQILVFAASFLLMVIAGHWLNYICRKHNEENKKSPAIDGFTE
ncbi:hypothetical protein [Parabacteroides sp. Marseille-P3160]|uniref:hypothetical protein n=1 Tax=Parabacteroides sp. Marseille-P3160 TaxID=1917887 RepID=UPI0009B9CD2A|nr:hypothetical protein [Parabacteroides sp. Marseille-P3160]